MVIIMSLDKSIRMIKSLIIGPVAVSRISINIIIGFIFRRAIVRLFIEMPLGMPARIVIYRPWITVPCKRYTGTEK
jgi:hypothetical protein